MFSVSRISVTQVLGTIAMFLMAGCSTTQGFINKALENNKLF
jgi:hypothetical protein